MELIINIPETMIQELKDGCFGVKHNVYELAGCIMNGIPLDKIKTESDDLKDILVGLQLEIENEVLADDPNTLLPFLQARESCVAVIQQKINKLKGEEESIMGRNDNFFRESAKDN